MFGIATKRDGKNYFKSGSEMYEYCIELLRKQNFICNVSKILMSDTLDSEANRRIFAPSLNAKDAVKGHCKDNLEWIISCLNNTNQDKQKRNFMILITRQLGIQRGFTSIWD